MHSLWGFLGKHVCSVNKNVISVFINWWGISHEYLQSFFPMQMRICFNTTNLSPLFNSFSVMSVTLKLNSKEVTNMLAAYLVTGANKTEPVLHLIFLTQFFSNVDSDRKKFQYFERANNVRTP